MKKTKGIHQRVSSSKDENKKKISLSLGLTCKSINNINNEKEIRRHKF